MGKRRRGKKKEPHQPKKDSVGLKKKAMEGEKEFLTIVNYWKVLNLSSQKDIIRIDKQDLIKKIKEKQRNVCSCANCGRRRQYLEKEVDRLYSQFCEELNFRSRPKRGENEEEEEFLDEIEEISEEEKQFAEFGKSLRLLPSGSQITVSAEWLDDNRGHAVHLFHRFNKAEVRESFDSLMGATGGGSMSISSLKRKGKRGYDHMGLGLTNSKDDVADGMRDHVSSSDHARGGGGYGNHHSRDGSGGSHHHGFSDMVHHLHHGFSRISHYQSNLSKKFDFSDDDDDDDDLDSASDIMTSEDDDEFEAENPRSLHQHDYALVEKKWRESKRMFRLYAAKLFYEKVVLSFKDKEAREVQNQLIESEFHTSTASTKKTTGKRKNARRKKKKTKRQKRKEELQTVVDTVEAVPVDTVDDSLASSSLLFGDEMKREEIQRQLVALARKKIEKRKNVVFAT